jgi:dTDP-4-amino-4,6-dideoxygalactose transaminase
LRNHGMVRAPEAFEHRALAFEGDEPNPHYYEMHEIGWNYRIPDILCALGMSQLQKLDRFWRRRAALAARYDQLLRPLAPALRPVPHGAHPHGWHLYAILVDFAGIGTSRAGFMHSLTADGIGTQVHYIPVHHQPYYRHRYGAIALPGADAYYARCLSIPMFPAMNDADVEHVAQALGRLIGARP